jgi:putative transposase
MLDEMTKPKGISKFTLKNSNYLPHWQRPGEKYFVTFNTYGRRILSPPSRSVVLNGLLHWDKEFLGENINYSRLKFIMGVVMPDHVHAIIKPLQRTSDIYWDLSDLMHSIKGFTAKQINKIENTYGQKVWQTEIFDRIIRDDREYDSIREYIAHNPVKAGLSERGVEYPWFKARSEFIEDKCAIDTLEEIEKLKESDNSDLSYCFLIKVTY